MTEKKDETPEQKPEIDRDTLLQALIAIFATFRVREHREEGN